MNGSLPNATLTPPNETVIRPDDATWILTSAFIIFTMQSGFGLLEAGMVSKKNETNIMVKNAVDVIYGGLSYWLFGFAFSFGVDEGSNPFCGIGYFMTDADESEMGEVFAKYFFQLSFATTATTIVSGAMAERVNLKAYTLFSFVNTLAFCFPAHWIWGKNGWLKTMGVVDVAGCGPVHLVGGVSGLVATLVLKPRTGRYDKKGNPNKLTMASPTNVLLGTFMLWWGWLGFNCGSTFGITGGKWKLASRSAVVTLNGSIGGGIFGMVYSYIAYKDKLLIDQFATGILGGLVSITAICAVARPWESFIIGFVGGLIACMGCTMLTKLRIDDPVGCVPTHFFSSVWGLIAVGLFAEKDTLENLSEDYGVFKGGSWKKLGVQLLATVVVSVWSATVTFIVLIIIDRLIPLRMPLVMELEGADKWEHGIEAESFMESNAVMVTQGVLNYEMETESENHEVADSTGQQIPRLKNCESRNNTTAFKKKLLRIKSSHSRRRHTLSYDLKSIKNRSHSVDIERDLCNETIVHQVAIVSNGINNTNPSINSPCRELSFGEPHISLGELNSSKVEEYKCHGAKEAQT
ncbi:putative ammonium transporter 3 [Actinia tenebrosa]|uniref:Ammonium transporter n=1 Tax=Actinia tenebrosa TaxID=6105 RepID=A0A6P8IBF7_ACTTE|nr:putative ammonium transporter 3 [Actinia tenebrosa]XP_031564625.1 putative ammonium transporter 3 [Actinia tenebrosa]XP_031564626.1 putative ammonium transporter 3 [Actinia tenebrosa]XP_031564627.1 putative ammonium transporter 3 [Actinia tenebrosa]XP_031564628.1 putative ammonium transporter 3 [Actinia tenebrosa]